jgi:hypothetical protein
MSASADKWSRVAALRPARGAVSPRSSAPSNELDSLAQLLGAEVSRNRYGEHLAIRRWFSTPECCEPTPEALEMLLPPKSAPRNARHFHNEGAADPSQWLFLDTETTGLAGGTGTYPFLIGIAWWDSGGLQVEQFFMRDYTEEHSLLHELRARLAERPVLITFNGKSFDWPLLETRFTLTRAIAPPRLSAHLDLLHPARALWRLRLGSVRLVELERSVLDAPRLGWRRDDDIDSAMIPQFYFDFLRGGPAEPLAAVAHHNRMDLRGLAALLGKVTSLLADGDLLPRSSEDALDLFGLSRFFHRRGHSQRARSACERALESGLPGEFRPVAGRELALLAKRDGDFSRAAAIWEELAAHPNDGVDACEQLAIHHERRTRDLARALEYTQLALRKLRHLRRSPASPLPASRAARLQARLEHRLTRLARRLGTTRSGRWRILDES